MLLKALDYVVSPEDEAHAHYHTSQIVEILLPKSTVLIEVERMLDQGVEVDTSSRASMWR